jgi:hypothetical protein
LTVRGETKREFSFNKIQKQEEYQKEERWSERIFLNHVVTVIFSLFVGSIYDLSQL